MRWVVLALLLAGCSRLAPSLKVPEPSSRTWTSGRLYFHGHEIVAPLTLTKHDSSLTIQGFHRIRAGTLERTPEPVLMQFLPPVPQSPPPADAMPDSNYLVLRAAGAYGTLARKRGVSAREAEDSVVAYLNRNGRVKAASTNGYATYIEFKNGESMVIMGDREHRSVPPKPAVLIDGGTARTFVDRERFKLNMV